VREGLAAGSTAGCSFRSGECSSSGPPAGSKLNQLSAGLNGRGRPSSSKNRRRKHRSLSASMAAREAVLNHTGSASGAYPCSCASHRRRFLARLLRSPSSSAKIRLIVSSESLLGASFFSGTVRLGVCVTGFVSFLVFLFLAFPPLSPDSSVFVGFGFTPKPRFLAVGLGVASAAVAQWTGCPLTARWGLTACVQGCAWTDAVRGGDEQDVGDGVEGARGGKAGSGARFRWAWQL